MPVVAGNLSSALDIQCDGSLNGDLMGADGVVPQDADWISINILSNGLQIHHLLPWDYRFLALAWHQLFLISPLYRASVEHGDWLCHSLYMFTGLVPGVFAPHIWGWQLNCCLPNQMRVIRYRYYISKIILEEHLIWFSKKDVSERIKHVL